MVFQPRKNIPADAMAIVLIVLHIMVIVMEDGTMDMGIIMVVNLEEIRVAVVPTNIW